MTTKSIDGNGGAATPSTEFHELRNNWMTLVNEFAQEYPITAGIVAIAGSFFGFFTLLHFSISALISGAFLLTIGASTAIAIQKNWDAYWNNLRPSIWEVKDYLFSSKVASAGN